MNVSSEIEKRAADIKLLLMDCDGVLTDGRIWILPDGEDQKAFNTRDGLGLALLHRSGLKSGVISGRRSKAMESRAVALGVSYVFHGRDDKTAAFDEILIKSSLREDEVAYIGDDLPDIPLMKRAGLAVAVADAAPEACLLAHYVTIAKGGHGAVRELIEIVLKSQGLWGDAVREYLG